MVDPPRPLPMGAYTVGIICALGLEMQAVRHLLDSEHGSLPVRSDDSNIYVLGELSGHNVVIACLPGIQGKGAAAIAANNLSRTFPSIKYRLMVGIGGGVPNLETDIRLGDVVISMPTANHGGIMQYDYGKETETGFVLKGFTATPPSVLRSAVYKMRHENDGLPFSEIAPLVPQRPLEPDVFAKPKKVIQRPDRPNNTPKVFYGLVASGDSVVKTTRVREEVNQLLGGDVLCYEMEAAGFIHEFPALVIRGISDYADSHKNDVWQPYAAGTAAWCAKAILRNLEPEQAFPVDRIIEKHLLDEFLADICESDPLNEMVRIQQSKGGILSACYQWIVESNGFQRWRNQRSTSLLWMKGGPGKGKTMTLIGLSERLNKPHLAGDGDSTPNFACFFFQNNVPHLNNATSALRALIWRLLWNFNSLSKYIPDEYRCKKGHRLGIFEGPNAFAILATMFSHMLGDKSIGECVLIIDAVDECETNMDLSLDWIINQTSRSQSRVKWLLSSRPNIAIGDSLRAADCVELLSLDDNPARVEAAVEYIIENKAEQLAQRKSLSNEILKDVKMTLKRKAESTFLWVALVAQRLLRCPRMNIRKELDKLPSGLVPLYDHSLAQIEGYTDFGDGDLLRGALRVAILAFRPLGIEELILMTERADISSDDIPELVDLCSCFLMLRDKLVFLQHQSVKEYFCTGPGQRIFSEGSGICIEHKSLFERLLGGMEARLHRDVYSLWHPGSHIDHIAVPDPDPLSGLGYAATYWIEHIGMCLEGTLSVPRNADSSSERNRVYNFLQCHFNHWLEVLSLMQQIKKAPMVMHRLSRIIETHFSEDNALKSFVEDAYQFTLYNMSRAQDTPLQIYFSGLTFTPQRSVIRSMFSDEIPTWLKNPDNLDEQWSPCLHMLEGHMEPVVSVIFSSDTHLVVSGSEDHTIRVWDTATGACLQILKGHEALISHIAISPDSAHIASSALDQTVRLWGLQSGELKMILKIKDRIDSIAFSMDGHQLILLSALNHVQIWDINTASLVRAYQLHPSLRSPTVLSQNGRWVASASYDGGIWVGEAGTGLMKKAFQQNGKILSLRIISGEPDIICLVADSSVELWSIEPRVRLSHFHAGSDRILMAYMLSDGCCVAVAAYESMRLWDMQREVILQTFAGYTDAVVDIALSTDGHKMASASMDKTVRIWNSASRFGTAKACAPGVPIYCLVLAPDGQSVASGSYDGHVKVWDLATGIIAQQFSHPNAVAVHTWDCSTGAVLQSSGGDLQSLRKEYCLPEFLPCDEDLDSLKPALWGERDTGVPSRGIHYQDSWIFLDGKKILWVPLTYQPCQLVATDTVAVIGCYTGQVLIFDFSSLYDQESIAASRGLPQGSTLH
ncbi:hypothetical protein BDV06DRAFT_224064 [Aspergillus oleicola]